MNKCKRMSNRLVFTFACDAISPSKQFTLTVTRQRKVIALSLLKCDYSMKLESRVSNRHDFAVGVFVALVFIQFKSEELKSGMNKKKTVIRAPDSLNA